MTPPKNDELMPEKICVMLTDRLQIVPPDFPHTKYLRADIAAQGEDEGWRDISTAKCDGGPVDILLNGNARIPDCYFDYYTKEWLMCGTDVPVVGQYDPVNKITHWMKIPNLPSQEEK